MSLESLERAYRDFEPFIRTGVDNSARVQKLGVGAESTAWRIEIDGNYYVYKRANPLNWRGRPRNVDAYTRDKAEVYVRGLGVAGLEQIKAASFKEGITVYEYVCGTNMSRLDAHGYDPAMLTFLPAVEETVVAATDARIQFDGTNRGGGNAVYDSSLGFTFIDYQDLNQEIDRQENRIYALESMGRLGVRLSFEYGARLASS